MNARRVIMLGSLGVVTALGIGLAGAAGAGDGSNSTKSARGGLLATTDRYQFEVFCYPTGLRLFPSSKDGTALDTALLSGTASFHHPNSPNVWFSRPLRPVVGRGATSGSLDLAVGLENAPATGARVTFEISGLPDPSESTATFTVPLEFVSAPASTRAVVTQGASASAPRYSYGPGYYGYGYYESTSPVTSSPRTTGARVYTTAPSRSYSAGESVGGRHRDWTVGRDNPIAKPWLRPMD
jgi:hypothetical protein